MAPENSTARGAAQTARYFVRSRRIAGSHPRAGRSLAMRPAFTPCMSNVSVDEPTMTWRRWLRDAGVSGVDPEHGVQFGDSVLLTEAAVRGQGVALGRTSLVADHLATGRLVRPLNTSRPGDFAYWSVTTAAGAQQARIRAFVEWIEDTVARERD